MKERSALLWGLSLLVVSIQYALFAATVGGPWGGLVLFASALVVNNLLSALSLGDRLPDDALLVPNASFWLGSELRRAALRHLTGGVVCLSSALFNVFLVMALQTVIDRSQGHAQTFPSLALGATALGALVFPFAFARWAFRTTEENR
jgi:hypothetical protein